MSAGQRPTVRALRLGSELRRLREAAGVDMKTAAERIGGDKPKISRMETGKQGVTKAELEVLLQLYSVEDRKIVAALDALRATRRRPDWWDQYGTILGPQLRERLAIERDAVRILCFQPLLIPGLLQTPEYARVVNLGVARDASPDQIESLTQVRMVRQEIFKRDSPPQYVCVLDEAVLRRSVGGPAVMAGQLKHLLTAIEPPLTSVQVIPFSNGWHPGLDGSFTIYAYPDPMDLDVVVSEYLDGALYLEEDRTVDQYRLAFDELRTLALSSGQSIDLISRIARDLEEM